MVLLLQKLFAGMLDTLLSRISCRLPCINNDEIELLSREDIVILRTRRGSTRLNQDEASDLLDVLVAIELRRSHRSVYSLRNMEVLVTAESICFQLLDHSQFSWIERLTARFLGPHRMYSITFSLSELSPRIDELKRVVAETLNCGLVYDYTR